MSFNLPVDGTVQASSLIPVFRELEGREVFDHVQGAGGKGEARRTCHVSFGVR